MTPRPEKPAGALNRRKLIRVGLALGLAGLASAPRRGGQIAAASGQLAGANLAEVALLSGWRRTWDLIVPISTIRSLPRSFLLYDRAAGEARCRLAAPDDAQARA